MSDQTQTEQKLSLYCDQSAGGFVHSHRRFCFFSVDEKRSLICKLRSVSVVFLFRLREILHPPSKSAGDFSDFVLGVVDARNRGNFFLKTGLPESGSSGSPTTRSRFQVYSTLLEPFPFHWDKNISTILMIFLVQEQWQVATLYLGWADFPLLLWKIMIQQRNVTEGGVKKFESRIS